MSQRSHLAVVAIHMDSASLLIGGALAGVLTSEQRKANIRNHVATMKRVRTEQGIYRPGDFRKARLP
jgi:hypothetical protein